MTNLRFTITPVMVTAVLLAILLPQYAIANSGLRGVGAAYALLAMIFIGFSLVNFFLVFLNMFLKKKWLRIVGIVTLTLNVLLLLWLNTILDEIGRLSLFVGAILAVEAFFIYKSKQKPTA